jgi:hypothetical protein
MAYLVVPVAALVRGDPMVAVPAIAVATVRVEAVAADLIHVVVLAHVGLPVLAVGDGEVNVVPARLATVVAKAAELSEVGWAFLLRQIARAVVVDDLGGRLAAAEVLAVGATVERRAIVVGGV